MTDELWRKSALELAAMIAAKQVSSHEVVLSHLARIDLVNPQVNGVTEHLAESALAAAYAADHTAPVGPFHGVPFTVKANIDLVGSSTNWGVPALAEAMPTEDAVVVERMKAAGAIPLARTNLPEMAMRISTDNPLYGRTVNPWDATRVAGGSSGGEAACLATGMSPMGLGNDIGGSLRNPAYCCGITSLKPSAGRIPMVGTYPSPDQPLSFRLMDVEGPMARTVKDIEVMFQQLAGWHPRDPGSVSAPLTGPAVGNRVGLVTSIEGLALPAATVAAIQQAGELLRAQGHVVEDVTVPELARVNELWARVMTLDAAQNLPMMQQVMSPRTAGLMEQMTTRFGADSMAISTLFVERDRLARAWSAFLEDYPVLVGPTWTDGPFLHDEDIDPDTGIDLTLGRLQFITPGNLFGIPSVALPMGVSEGLPTGVQIYAQRWREDVALRAAQLIESKLAAITPMDPVV